ncbi:4Fe-4S binding protein [Candidatus Aminicenantes bacterium AH-873-B07]|nr:4Fe-4S binding protein [Candidatus Aminicenantes bacterium AH-873-B07]
MVLRAKRYSYSPNIIEVKKDDLLILRFISEDVTHGFFLDGYGTEFYAHPGEIREIIIKANKVGRFTFRCSRTCGEFHPYMVGYLIVTPNWHQHLGFLLIFLFGIFSLVLTITGKQSPQNKLFWKIPLNWRFELTKFKWFHSIVKSRFFPLIPIIVNLFIFTVIIFAAFVGGFQPGNYNFGIMIVWILWWSLLMLFMVPIIGRFWCMICPFPLFGDWFQRGSLVKVKRKKLNGMNKKWVRNLRNLWPLVILFWITTLFSGFFTVRPFATFLLLAAIIIGACIIAIIYEKRTFCLYICPVSGFQGLYSNFSMTEIRVKDPEICKNHRTKDCITGNDKGYGCPWQELPFDMNRNTYCGMCFECIKTCTYDNMAFNIRPPGVDFLNPRKKTDDLYKRRDLDEAFKALTMLGIFLTFFLAFQGPFQYFKDTIRAITLPKFLTYILESAFLDFVFVPLTYLFFVFISKKLSGKRDISLRKIFVEYSYTLVPIGLAVWAAFSLAIILPNGSYLWHIISDPFAWGWNLFGTARIPWKPYLTNFLPYLQIFVLIFGFIFALEYGYKFSRNLYKNEEKAKKGWIPILIYLILLNLFFVFIFLGG